MEVWNREDSYSNLSEIKKPVIGHEQVDKNFTFFNLILFYNQINKCAKKITYYF